MPNFNFNHENQSSCLFLVVLKHLIKYLSRTFLIRYDVITNFMASYSKFVEMTIQITSQNKDNSIEDLLTLYLTGWREICPTKIPSPLMIPKLLYDPSYSVN
ncbi:hypothetical protein RF11_14861 [Thelohanellus kitauei]|uniref:Uncharacterized protein n=1 Tax=Thelohanellus kitauei TaxID=669202 RepID=A0A0C2JME6_THEKT|nr:hypothetical protein RF11_14861 [Thelohanellus kitauei]